MPRVRVKDVGGATMEATDIDGHLLPAFYMEDAEIRDIYYNIPNFFCRHDDVMLCGFPKTGINWVFEILMMLLTKSGAPVATMKYVSMMETTSESAISDLPSPRVLNTHLPFRMLPKDLTTKQVKTVLVVRNPKDTAVSYYHHMRGLRQYNYSGRWEDWLLPYITGKYEYGKYTDYLLEWERQINTGVGFPLHVVFYEDLKKDPVGEVQRLAHFLGTSVNPDLIGDIVNNSSFQKMAKDKLPQDLKNAIFKRDFEFFRKGEVGDWRQWFTEEQNRRFDEIWSAEMGNSRWKFIYTQGSSKL